MDEYIAITNGQISPSAYVAQKVLRILCGTDSIARSMVYGWKVFGLNAGVKPVKPQQIFSMVR